MYTHTHGAGTKGGPFSHAADRVWRAYFVVSFCFSFHLQLIYSPTVTGRDGERQGGGKSGRVRVACRFQALHD
jgi:hypothetical protein